ncbi:MAG: DUF21 domain-containing protein [Verrucomicrobia bacterium]|nr:DUF21 domain-containing protein [Verrucomicrobiota bacterium]
MGIALVLSFLFSGMEAGVAALSRVRIRSLMSQGNERAAVLHGFLEHPENFLWTILVGNVLANFTAVALVVSKIHTLAGGRVWLFLVGLVVLAALIYAVCELLPKMLFRLFPNRLCLLLAKPFRWIHVLLSPPVRLLSGLSGALLSWTGGRTFTSHVFGNREEIRFLMHEAGHNFTTDERAMIARVLDLQGVTLRQIAVPMANAASVDADALMSDVLKLGRESQHTRLPVWRKEGGRRRVVGLVNLNSVLFGEQPDLARPAADFLRPALYLEEDLRLEVALQRMQRSGNRLAIVLGPDRSERGLVSQQDILKFIFGEVALS